MQRVLRVQQSEIEALARNMVEQPAARMMQDAGALMQQMQFPPEKFQSTCKQIEAEVRKYIDEAFPIVRDRAIKLAPSTIGVALETKLSEDELKQLLAWLESPVSKKFQQVTAEAGRDFAQQVSREAAPLVQPKVVALEGRVRVILGVPPQAGVAPQGSASAADSAPTASAPRAKPPSK